MFAFIQLMCGEYLIRLPQTEVARDKNQDRLNERRYL